MIPHATTRAEHALAKYLIGAATVSGTVIVCASGIIVARSISSAELALRAVIVAVAVACLALLWQLDHLLARNTSIAILVYGAVDLDHSRGPRGVAGREGAVAIIWEAATLDLSTFLIAGVRLGVA